MAAFFVMGVQTERALKRERVFKDRINPLETLADIEVVERYRLPRACIYELCDLLLPDIANVSNRSHAIPPIIKVLVTLRYLGKGSFFSECGDLHGISKSSVSRSVEEVTDSICNRLKNVKFPTTYEEIVDTKRNFHSLANFPNVVGAIDGTLIPIIAPKENEADYVCRKGYHALNVQAVVDTSLRFTNLVCRWPGSTHDSFIFNNSRLKQRLEENDDGWLLGDSGYALKRYLMTPITNPSNRAQERYNKAHSKTRVVVERAFGVSKSRFRCLHKSGGCLPFTPSKNVKIVTAAFKLHNKCIDDKVPMPPLEDEVEVDGDNYIYQEDNVTGQSIRDRIVQRFA